MNRDPNGQQYQNQQNHQNPYGGHEQQNPGINYGQPPQTQPPIGQNPNNLPPGSYPPREQMQQDRNQVNPGYGGPPPQQYQGYSQGGNPQPQPGAPNYQNAQGYRNEAPGAGYQSQINPAGGQPQERVQNYNSFHEASAPIPQSNPNLQSNMNKPHDYSHQNERSLNNTQIYRGEGGIPASYGQPGMPEMQRPPPLSGAGPGSDQNVIGGFLGQSSNQPPQQQIGTQQYGLNPSARGGVPESSQSFAFSTELGATNQGQIPGQNMTGGNRGAQDAQSMDIGELNRMAEYYATNSDYPKVSSNL